MPPPDSERGPAPGPVAMFTGNENAAKDSAPPANLKITGRSRLWAVAAHLPGRAALRFAPARRRRKGRA
jgi:hypothetical protein